MYVCSSDPRSECMNWIAIAIAIAIATTTTSRATNPKGTKINSTPNKIATNVPSHQKHGNRSGKDQLPLSAVGRR